MSAMPVVLYVDDDPLSREVMQMTLTDELNLPVFYIFEDSTDFIAHVESLDPPPDLFLLDIHLKPYDGFEMLDMIRHHPHFAVCIVVALTASVMNEEVQRLKTAGFDSIIAKPINLDVFSDIFIRICQGDQIWSI